MAVDAQGNQGRLQDGYLAMSPRYRDLYSQLAGSGFLSVLKVSSVRA